MFERRPIFGFILGLNVCVLIWRISVQDTTLLENNNNDNANVARSNNMGDGNIFAYQNGEQRQQEQLLKPYKQFNVDYADLPAARQLYAGKHLLSQQINDQAATALATATANNIRTGSEEEYLLHLLRKSDYKHLRIINHRSAEGTSNEASTLANNISITTKAQVATHSLPSEDLAKLIDLHNFSYYMSQPSCGANVKVLILVHSAPDNYDKRQLIRDTWGSIALSQTPLRVLFLLGAVLNPERQSKLERENAQYADLVQGSFIDAYRNMTYKHVMALKWFLYNCPNAQILTKVDDDVFVNTPSLLKHSADNVVMASTGSTVAAQITGKTKFEVPKSFFLHPQKLLFCQENIGAEVKRSYRSKWRVSFKEYADRYYPPYCPGYAIIYSPDVVYQLYVSAQRQRYFWIDDVHITGVLAQHNRINITTSSNYVLQSKKYDQLLLAGKTDLSELKFLFAWHSISPQQARAFWRLHVPATPMPTLTLTSTPTPKPKSTTTQQSSMSLTMVTLRTLTTSTSSSLEQVDISSPRKLSLQTGSANGSQFQALNSSTFENFR